MRITSYKIALIMLAYYLLSYSVVHYFDLDSENNRVFSMLFMVLEWATPLVLLCFFLPKKKHRRRELYSHFFFTIALCVGVHSVVKMFMYLYIDPSRSEVVAEKIASQIIEKMELRERENQMNMDFNKKKEFNRIYERVKKKFELKGILESAFFDIIYYFLVSLFVVRLARHKIVLLCLLGFAIVL